MQICKPQQVMIICTVAATSTLDEVCGKGFSRCRDQSQMLLGSKEWLESTPSLVFGVIQETRTGHFQCVWDGDSESSIPWKYFALIFPTSKGKSSNRENILQYIPAILTLWRRCELWASLGYRVRHTSKEKHIKIIKILLKVNCKQEDFFV